MLLREIALANRITNTAKTLAAALCLIALGWFAYAPGLGGGFLFDDYANLPSLGMSGPVNNGAALVRYLTSGTADPLGRPLALASFLLDAHDWPADPYPFKRTNLLLHLMNGLLVWLLCSQLTRALYPTLPRERVKYAAWLASALWTLHPFLVSTTLYIVQREAMLPATFTLIALSAWLTGRERLFRGERSLGWLLLVAVTMAAATLSKINGVVLVFLILCIEAVMPKVRTLPRHPNARWYRFAVMLCAAAAIAIIVALLYVAIVLTLNGVPGRPWTEPERLLTEPRIVWTYLGRLWIPRPFTAGVFNDAVVVSTSLLQPITTVFSLMALIALALGAWAVRGAKPALALSILFYLSAHLIESSSIPLELYFEHRNYLPALLMFWPLALWLARPAALRPSAQTQLSQAVRISLPLLIIAGLTFLTRSNSSLWGDTQHQARMWAALNPESPRAQVSAAQEEIANGDAQGAVARLEPLLSRRPDEVQIAINLIAAHCDLGDLSTQNLTAAQHALRSTSDPGSLLVSWFDRTVTSVVSAGCPRLTLKDLGDLARAGLQNRRLPAGRRQDLEHVLGDIALASNDSSNALSHYDQAALLDMNEGIILAQAAALGSAGYPALGLQHIALLHQLKMRRKVAPGMPMLHQWVLDHQQYWAHEREALTRQLRLDAEKQG